MGLDAAEITLMSNRWRMTLRAAEGEVAEVDGQSEWPGASPTTARAMR